MRRRTPPSESRTPREGSAPITASQVWPASRPSRIVSALAQSTAASVGSNCDPARFSARSMAAPVPPMRWATSTNSPIMRQPRRDGNGLAFEVPGPALAVPLLVGGADRLLDTDRQSELLGQSPGQRRVLLDHPVEVAVPGDGELHADPEAVQRWVAAPQQPQGRQRSAQGPKLVVVLAGLQGDVVAEPLGLLVGVGVAAHVDQQGRVVDDRALLLVEADAFGQAQGDHALAQHVLHRLAEAQVDPEGQGGHQLGQSHPGRIAPTTAIHGADATAGRRRRTGADGALDDLSGGGSVDVLDLRATAGSVRPDGTSPTNVRPIEITRYVRGLCRSCPLSDGTPLPVG